MKNLPILYKMVIGLGVTIVLSIGGFVFTVRSIRTSLEKQLINQSQAELAIFTLNFADRLSQKEEHLGEVDLATLIAAKKRSTQQQALITTILNEAQRERKVDYTVLVDTDLKVVGATANIPINTKFDPGGLVTKSLSRGENITAYANESYSALIKFLPTLTQTEGQALVRYDIKQITTTDQTLVGFAVLVNVLEAPELEIVDGTNRSIGNGFSLVVAGTDQIALGAMLEGEQTRFLEVVPPEIQRIVPQKPTETIFSAWNNVGNAAKSPIAGGTIRSQEISLKGKTYTLAYAPILSIDGTPVGLLVRGTPQDNLNQLLAETIGQVIAIATILFILGIVIAILVGRTVTVPVQKLERIAQKYIDGDLSERAAVDAQDEIGVLANVFNRMADSIQQRQSDQIAAQAEVEAQSFVLQEEVGKLLDVVSELESGDLTVEAEVSDQATGLVADTLNRLIEQLATTVATVLSTTRQVARSAETLEELAIAVAQNAQEQVDLVDRANQGMRNVNELAQGASEQAVATGSALVSAQDAVQQGQQEMIQLTAAINTLQSGTTEMVRRIKSLGEFVDLAKQFVQDQKRLASLTQVLAMNASMVAARAIEQREPDQFASVAREFEAIAAQVNKLANQTSQGLALLQQRTGFIEIVVSGINQDIVDVSNLVSSFTTSVTETGQAFLNIKNVTEEVAKLGQSVTESSQSIAQAVKITFDSVRDIAIAAERSAQQSSFTREQSTEMGEMARLLLENVQFFRLPPSKLGDQPLITGKS